MTLRLLVPAVLFASGLAACATTGSGRLPARIIVERGGFIPEGIEFDTTARRLLVGSLVEGTIYEVAPDGRLITFATDDELVSSAGIEADEPRDRLLVTNGDRSVFNGEGAGIAKLGAYRLSTGQRIAMVDLATVAGRSGDTAVFPNDVAVGPDGTAYVTDTYRNLIYAVGADYRASVFYRFEPTPGLGLNGIVYHPDGFLIVVGIGGQGVLYRVPLDRPSAARPIDLSQPATGADGLVWSADGRLIVVSNSTSSATAYTSDDGWTSARLVGTAAFEGQATTGAAVDDEIYVVLPHFNDDDPPVILRATP